MKKATVKTSISLDPEVLDKAKEKVEGTGQSVSSYINVLIRADVGLAKAKPPARSKQAA